MLRIIYKENLAIGHLQAKDVGRVTAKILLWYNDFMQGIQNSESLVIDEITFYKELKDPFSDSICVEIKGKIFTHLVELLIWIRLSEVFSRKMKLSLENKLTSRLLEKTKEIKEIISRQDMELSKIIICLAL